MSQGALTAPTCGQSEASALESTVPTGTRVNVVRGQTKSGAARLWLVVGEDVVAAAIEVVLPEYPGYRRTHWTFVGYGSGMPTAMLDAPTEADAREWLQWMGELYDASQISPDSCSAKR